MEIEYHADDYGLFPAQSLRIINCCRNGVVNGVSVIPNSPYLSECMNYLKPFMESVQVAVHLNFLEGYSICTPDQIPDLVDLKGKFSISFGRLLLASVFPPLRNRYRTQLKQEIRAQINAVFPYLNGKALRLDGHAHFHMIPIVFDALMDVIQSDHLKFSYIRIPKEKISLYAAHRKELEYFRPVNLMKSIILNVLSERNLHKYKSFLAEEKKNIFVGVMYSGRMNYKNLSIMIPTAVKLAKQFGGHLELLAHPGGVYEEADIQQLTNLNDIAFLTSAFRKEEADAFISLKNLHVDKAVENE